MVESNPDAMMKDKMNMFGYKGDLFWGGYSFEAPFVTFLPHNSWRGCFHDCLVKKNTQRTCLVV